MSHQNTSNADIPFGSKSVMRAGASCHHTSDEKFLVLPIIQHSDQAKTVKEYLYYEIEDGLPAGEARSLKTPHAAAKHRG
eukprot:1428806-Pleurochrysis_carterae.AAC.1